jgi:hypothetical protein
VHARALQGVLREVDVTDADKVVRAFDDVTGALVEPLYRATLAFDRHRLAELAGEISGVPYETDDQGWTMAKALTAAALADPDALRLNARVALLLEPAAQVLSDPDALRPGCPDTGPHAGCGGTAVSPAGAKPCGAARRDMCLSREVSPNRRRSWRRRGRPRGRRPAGRRSRRRPGPAP